MEIVGNCALPCTWEVSWGVRAPVWQWKATPVTLFLACEEGDGHTCFGSCEPKAPERRFPGHTVSLSIGHIGAVLMRSHVQKAYHISTHWTEEGQTCILCFHSTFGHLSPSHPSMQHYSLISGTEGNWELDLTCFAGVFKDVRLHVQ